MPYLTIKEVANLFGVCEKTIYRLLNKGKLPGVKIGGQWRFSRQEIQERLKQEQIQTTPRPAIITTNTKEISLNEALLAGGIFFQIPGTSIEEVLENAVTNIYQNSKPEQQKLVNALLFRERLCTTAIGQGIALPHPRHPSSFHFGHSSISLCFLENALDLEATDNQPINTLFFVFAKTEKEHLHLLKILASMLHQHDFINILKPTSNRLEIFQVLQALEQPSVEFTRRGGN